MNIIKNVNGTTLHIDLEGRLDTVTAPELEAVLKESLDGMTELVLDFEKLAYVSSAGLRVLLSNHKIMSKRDGMKIIHVNQSIMEIFDVTGFGDILEIE